MGKVYIVSLHYDNHGEYDMNYQYDEVLDIFDTKEKAENFIKSWMPDSIVSKSKEEEEARLKEEWNAMPDDEKADDFDNDFSEYFAYRARYIDKVLYNVRKRAAFRPFRFVTDVISKRILEYDAWDQRHRTSDLVIIEREVR